MVDGAGAWRQLVHVTLPGLVPTIVLMTVLSLGNVLNAGFDQVFNLYSPIVYETGDIIDTFVYRLAFNNAQFSVYYHRGRAVQIGHFVRHDRDLLCDFLVEPCQRIPRVLRRQAVARYRKSVFQEKPLSSSITS